MNRQYNIEIGPFQHYEDSLSAVLAAIMSASLVYSYEEEEDEPTFEENMINMLLEHGEYVNRNGTVGEA
jgi:hypothetical protein